MSTAKVRILVAEDEPRYIWAIQTNLEARGYAVLTAEDGEAALAVAASCSQPIQLLLTDIVMPGMNGRDLATALESLRPNIRHLFMSGYPAEVIANRCVIDEGVSFIQKPFRIAELADKVREVMDGA